MRHAQHDAIIDKYHQYMQNFLQAADRSYSQEQTAIYTRYAKRMAGLINDLQKVA